MNPYPSFPDVEDASSRLFEHGHLWIQEAIDGIPLRVQLERSGLLRFGDETRVYDPGEEPLAVGHAVRHVRDRLDREALREAVDDVEGVTFYGWATSKRTIEYDWDRIPSFLGVDVHSSASDGLLPPDVVEGIFRKLGLEPVNAVAKEIRAQDFDPQGYEIPDSNWYDGPAAGVLVRNKTGGRARIFTVDSGVCDEEPGGAADPEDLAERYATDARLEGIARKLEDDAVDFDVLYQRALEQLARTEPELRFDEGEEAAFRLFRSTVARRVQAVIDRQ